MKLQDGKRKREETVTERADSGSVRRGKNDFVISVQQRQTSGRFYRLAVYTAEGISFRERRILRWVEKMWILFRKMPIERNKMVSEGVTKW